MLRPVALGLAAGLLSACQAGATAPASAVPTHSSRGSVPGDATSTPSTATFAALPSAAPERIEGTFTSARYGYTWALPGGWTVTETPGAGGVHPGEPGLDTFTDGRGTTVTVGVTAVAPTQQLSSWICPVVVHLEDFHGEPREAVASMTLGGVPATISTFHFTAPPYRVLELEVQAIRGAQGFFLSWTDTLTPVVPDREQMSRYKQLLAGFSFA